MYKLIIFDLDGTLTESKQSLTSEMAALLAKLLAVTRVAIVSGGALPQFLTQVVAQLPSDANFANLYLLPTSGAALYEFSNEYGIKFTKNALQKKKRRPSKPLWKRRGRNRHHRFFGAIVGATHRISRQPGEHVRARTASAYLFEKSMGP